MKLSILLLLLFASFGKAAGLDADDAIARGRYLAGIGACAACHTPALVATNSRDDITFRSDPNWFSHLDQTRALSGGVPFILRFSTNSHGLVVTPNITSDDKTGIGKWTAAEIVEVLRTGKRPDGRVLFLFPPHTFYQNLAENDLFALAAYLKSTRPIETANSKPSLPFPTQVGSTSAIAKVAPESKGVKRAVYLMNGLVGCVECHSSHDENSGKLRPFVGGRIGDSLAGGFRLGPDLPLSSSDKGFAAWPYPGYALLFAGNLTRFGIGGDLSFVPSSEIVKSMRGGMSTQADKDGRPRQLAHTMLWQFYAAMNDDDAYSIAEFIKSLKYEPGPLDGKDRLYYFGSSSREAFKFFFGEQPSPQDIQAFNLKD